MDKIIVEGGQALRGEVRISGAKNAVLPILCAALLADAPVSIRNVPRLHDVRTTLRLLAELGAGIDIGDDYTIGIDPRSVMLRRSAICCCPVYAVYNAEMASRMAGVIT